MGLVEHSIKVLLLLLSHSILLDLLLKSIEVGEIILFLHHMIMLSDDILLLFLPPKLLSFEVANIFRFFALLFEPLMCLIVDILQVLDVLLALGLGMVVHLEGSL